MKGGNAYYFNYIIKIIRAKKKPCKTVLSRLYVIAHTTVPAKFTTVPALYVVFVIWVFPFVGYSNHAIKRVG